jgi:predicted O-linked N-acetylglucosamine transferase (SPINDLY family)
MMPKLIAPRMRLFWFESQSAYIATGLARSATYCVITKYSKATSTLPISRSTGTACPTSQVEIALRSSLLDAEALKNQGNAHKAAGERELAIESYRRALALQPDYAPALYNLGLALRESGRLEEAQTCFRRVVALDARDAEASIHLGDLLARSLRLDEAEQVLRRALAFAPLNALLWLQLGDIGIARFSDASLKMAAECFGRAAELAPELADAHHGLGVVHGLEERHDEALRCHLEALRHLPGSAAYAASALNEMQQLCDWSRFDELCAQVRRSLGADADRPVHPFLLVSLPTSPEEQLACARVYARSLASASAGAAPAPQRQPAPAGTRRRLGYLSSDFHSHATAYLAAELFELHDRSRFEVVGYSYGPEERSPMRERLTRAFDRFVDLRALPDSAAARAIAGDGVDILVELKGYTLRARPGIAALRPAPVQVSYLGYPGTMGAEFIDYLVGDRFVTPASDAARYSEKLVLLPHSYQVNDRRRAIGPTPSRAELGLPGQGLVFCSFNQVYKILPPVFDAWMRMLAAVPGSVLWLLEPNRWAPHNLRREAAARGVDPQRLLFSPPVPLESHLARMRAADLFLDTFPCNAHTTASDALWAGLPLLTCAGDTFASRVAGSLLRAVGMDELVTASLEDYEALGIRLARDRGALSAMRARLAQQRESAPLFDTPRFVRGLESAYEEMWRLHVSGASPRLIEV